MKTIKYLSLVCSISMVLFSAILMWNMGIASDEMWTVGEYVNKFSIYIWALFGLSLLQVFLSIYQIFRLKSK